MNSVIPGKSSVATSAEVPLFMRAVIVCAVACACVSAQVAYVVEAGSGHAAAKYLPSAGHPVTADSARGALQLPEFGNLPPVMIYNGGARAGGACIDQGASAIYSCNGFTVQREAHPLYNEPGLTTSVGLGVYFPSNTITGMAVDADGGVLYACDDHFLIAFDKDTFAPLQPADYLYWLDLGDRLSGLGWESASDTLWACATNGRVFNMDVNGDPVGPQPRSTVASVGTLTGLAVNTTNGVGAMQSPGCSFQIGGYHVMVTDGVNIYDAFANGGGPIPCSGNGTAHGLAYSGDGQLIPASSPCPLNGTAVGNPGNGGGFASIETTNAAMAGRPFGLSLTGGPINSPCSILFDYCPIQGDGVSLPTGDTMYIWPLSLTVEICPAMTDAFGVAQVMLPPAMFGTAPAGWQWSYQWYFPDLSNPSLYGCFSDAMTVTWGLR